MAHKRKRPSQPRTEAGEGQATLVPGTQAEAIPASPHSGKVHAPDHYRPSLDGTRFVFTYAQNNTTLHEDLWQSLLHYCRVNNAQLGIARGSYNIGAWKQMGGKTRDDEGIEAKEEGIWYDPRIEPYVIGENVEVCKGLLFCAELDINPTAVNPLTGLDTYTGSNSGIIPHPKVMLKSYATMKGTDARILCSTGSVTLRNYIDRRAGQIASFHHIYGAYVVEVDGRGNYYGRHLNADDNGTFYDCDRVYGPGWDSPASEFGRPLVTLGDVHVEKLDHKGFASALSMIKALDPIEVTIHDLLDFEHRNHHNMKDAYFLAEQKVLNQTVYKNLLTAVNFMRNLTQQFPDTAFTVIRSNHDQALKRWLNEADAHYDPDNAWLWHTLNAAQFKAINHKDFDFDIFAYAMEFVAQGSLRRVRFLKEDESHVVYGVEQGMHGHRGPNGTRGGVARSFRSLGIRTNTGHTHSPEINGGNYVAGVRGKLDMRYNAGPSSWAIGDIITHPNGKRQLIISKEGNWRA